MTIDDEKTNPYQSSLQTGQDQSATNWYRWRIFWRRAFLGCVVVFVMFLVSSKLLEAIFPRGTAFTIIDGTLALGQLVSFAFAGLSAIGWVVARAFSKPK